MPPGFGPAAHFSIDLMLEYTLRTYQSPTRLVQRLGAIKELGTEATLLGMRRPLLVTDAGVKAAGLLDTALEALRGSDVEPVVFDKVKANPGVDLVDAGAAEYRAQGCDGLVAIGGDDTLSVAVALSNSGFPVVGVPKTIDNDLSATEFCIGFDTAVGVVVEAKHLCMMMRGVEKQNSVMKTSCLLGSFKEDARTRSEFLALLRE